MSSMMMTLRRLFGASSSDVSGTAPAKPVDARKDHLKAQEDFKTAVRDGDVAAIDAILSSKRVSVDEELSGGRGLLQFAVMTNSIKAVKLLIERGADASRVDSLGASADTLARKSGSANMARVLHPA